MSVTKRARWPGWIVFATNSPETNCSSGQSRLSTCFTKRFQHTWWYNWNNTNGKYFRRGTAKGSFPCSTHCPSSTPTSPSSTTTTRTSNSRTTTTRLPTMTTTPHWDQITQVAQFCSQSMDRCVIGRSFAYSSSIFSQESHDNYFQPKTCNICLNLGDVPTLCDEKQRWMLPGANC